MTVMELENKMDTNDLGGGPPGSWWTPAERARAERKPKATTEEDAMVGAGVSKPTFGTRMRGIYASEDNPQRDGFYVETVTIPKGRMNAGKHYRLTDGCGNFWMYPVGSVELLEDE